MLRALSLTSSSPTAYRGQQQCCRFFMNHSSGKQSIHVRPATVHIAIPASPQDRKRFRQLKNKTPPPTRIKTVKPVHPNIGDRKDDVRPQKDDDPPPVIRELPPYHAPPWRPLPIKPIFSKLPRPVEATDRAHAGHQPAPEHVPFERSRRRAEKVETVYQENMHILATTQSPTDAWTAYSELLDVPCLPGQPDGPKIPFQHLHRLCRLLSQSQVKNRMLFLRLLSLMYYIKRSGGELQLFEWNTLIDVAGKGVRKPRPQDFKLAIDILNDMVTGRPPGHTFSPSEFPLLTAHEQYVEPDIVTYTTLLNHATKTLHGPALQQAGNLLNNSGLSPNRITLLCLLAYHTSSRSLVGVRNILGRMRREGLELGLDGVNSTLWAFAHNQRPDVVRTIYRILRHTIVPEPDEGEIVSLVQQLEVEEEVTIPLGMRPNEITFTATIQCMAYNGDLGMAIDVFLDMMLSDNSEVGAPLYLDEEGVWRPGRYVATLAIYRAIFLGYARHGEFIPDQETLAARLKAGRPWTLDSLEELFQAFLRLPQDAEPTKSVLYWIMVAFNKVSGEDLVLMRRVWQDLLDRFNGPWGGSQNRLQRLHRALSQSDRVAREQLRTMNIFSDPQSGWAYESGWR